MRGLIGGIIAFFVSYYALVTLAPLFNSLPGGSAAYLYAAMLALFMAAFVADQIDP